MSSAMDHPARREGRLSSSLPGNGPATLPGLEPFWQLQTMEGESLLFLAPADGSAPKAHLLFPPQQILSITSATGEQSFEAEKDFVWTPGSRVLTLPPGSRIPTLTDAQTHPSRGSQKFGTCRDRESDLLYTDLDDFHRVQVNVTYTHVAGDWRTPPTLMAKQSLPAMVAKLTQRRPINLVVLGDSISTGSNSSGVCNVPPHQPGYADLVAQAIQTRYGSTVSLTNLSVGGQVSAWGLTQMPAVAGARPDLVILAFGMNDASGNIPPQQFAQTIASQMSIIRKSVPDVEFILVASMTGNPEWTGTNMPLYPQYRDALWGLRQDGVAVADLTSLWIELTQRKGYLDLSGNGLNHPNDFGYRLYAQVILSLLGSANGVSKANVARSM